MGQTQRRMSKKRMRATNKSRKEAAAAMKTVDRLGKVAGTRTDMVEGEEEEVY